MRIWRDKSARCARSSTIWTTALSCSITNTGSTSSTARSVVFWRLPDELADSRPSFVRLMYHGRGAAAYAVSHDRLGDYVARQMDLIRTADDRPLNIELRNGEVIQFRCKPLPGGAAGS